MKIMKKWGLWLVALFAVASFSGCIKESEPYDLELQYGLDKDRIEAYNAQNFPGAIFHEVEDGIGIWYQVETSGTPGDYQYKLIGEGENKLIEAPIIKVRYVGKLLDGTVFDKNETESGVELRLARLITAWRIMFLPRTIDGAQIGGVLPYGLHPGAKVRFVAPSIFGYANSSQKNIPANSPLEYTVEVLDVLPPDTDNNY